MNIIKIQKYHKNDVRADYHITEDNLRWFSYNGLSTRIKLFPHSTRNYIITSEMYQEAWSPRNKFLEAVDINRRELL